MRLIAGCILILAGAVLYAAHWLGRVIHTPTTVGEPEATVLLVAAAALGLAGGTVAALWPDHTRNEGER